MNSNSNIENFHFSCEAEGSKEILRKFSPSGKNVMVICERADKKYTYALYFWEMSDYEYIGHGYWALSSQGGIYSELDSAAKEANLELELKL